MKRQWFILSAVSCLLIVFGIGCTANQVLNTSATQQLEYNPPRPEDAPAQIRDAVMLGYNIITETKKYAKPFVGNALNCHNCHFEGGITQGGKNGGISYVGVAAKYPKYRERQDYSVDLMTRINNCFARSLNGKPLPGDSREMTAMLTYFSWISKDIPIYAEIPWLGLPDLEKEQAGGKKDGGEVYAAICARCHGENGGGGKGGGHDENGPPLWGDDSFTTGAGMVRQSTLATFAYYNMPRHDPTLSKEQAWSVADYVTSRPRPAFDGVGQW